MTAPPILPLPDSTAQHVDENGKPKKELYNWLRSVQAFLSDPSKIKGVLGLATVATTGAYADLTGKPTLGTAAAQNVGTAAGNVVQMVAGPKLPAVDGSALTGITSGQPIPSSSTVIPVGDCLFAMCDPSGSPVANNGTQTTVKQAYWDSGLPGFSSSGTVLPGTWKNISGRTLNPTDVGLWVRTV